MLGENALSLLWVSAKKEEYCMNQQRGLAKSAHFFTNLNMMNPN
jgi:hypothetical protein